MPLDVGIKQVHYEYDMTVWAAICIIAPDRSLYWHQRQLAIVCKLTVQSNQDSVRVDPLYCTATYAFYEVVRSRAIVGCQVSMNSEGGGVMAAWQGRDRVVQIPAEQVQ